MVGRPEGGVSTQMRGTLRGRAERPGWNKVLRSDPEMRCSIFCLLVISFFLCVPAAHAAGPDCVACHEDLTKGKVVHPAVQMGCTSCHTAVDAADVPHKMRSKVPKGLSAEQMRLKKKVVHAAVQMGCTGCHNPHSSKNAKLLRSELPDLCFTCHEKKKFSGKTVHAPVGIGLCTSCHSPHQSDNEKLLVSVPPDLCYTCHDKSAFTKKIVHPPVAAGLCLSCHAPHASEEMALLRKDPPFVCLDCHAVIRKAPHAVSGFQSAGHPLGIAKKGKKYIEDPARPGKRFYCGSCHDPHSADSANLFRYGAKSSMDLCNACHKM
jgi:predicted CXXCH cytochrome family protein